jgi:hypothetical protein
MNNLYLISVPPHLVPVSEHTCRVTGILGIIYVVSELIEELMHTNSDFDLILIVDEKSSGEFLFLKLRRE